MKSPKIGAKLQRRRQRLLLAAGCSLTSSLLASTLHAANCNAKKDGISTGLFAVRSALPFLGGRYVQVKTTEERFAAPVAEREPSQPPTALTGDSR